MSTNLSAKCYQQNKERLYKTLMKDITTFSRKKKKKNDNMVVNVTKILHKMKKKKKMVEYRRKYYKVRNNTLLWLLESILIKKILILYKGKCKKLFSFALMFKKFSLNKQKMWKEI